MIKIYSVRFRPPKAINFKLVAFFCVYTCSFVSEVFYLGCKEWYALMRASAHNSSQPLYEYSIATKPLYKQNRLPKRAAYVCL